MKALRLKIFKGYSFVSVLLILLISLAVNQRALAAEVPLNLTDEEKAWIKSQAEITVGNEMDWPPFDYVENGKPAGYTIDVVRLVAQKTGLRIKFVNGHTWQKLLQLFKAGKIDVLPAMYDSEARRRYTLFTKSYYLQPSVMVVHESNKDIENINNLKGKRVVGIKGFATTKVLSNIVPDVRMVRVNNVLEGLKAVSLGNADAFIDSIGTVSHVLDNNYIPNVKIISNIDNKAIANPPLHMGISKDQSVLLGIFNKALASISRDEKNKLANHWFHLAASKKSQSTINKTILSSEQLEWLNKQTKIRVGIMNAWPPMDYVDVNGKPKGIGVKIIDAINKRLGNRLEIVPGLFKENFSAVKDKRLDALMDITPRPDREAFIHFTKPYIKVPHLIYTRKGEAPTIALSDLAGKKVGVEKGFFIVKVLQEKYPTVSVKEYKTTSDAIDALSKGEVDAYVGNRAVANYIIENELINNVIAQGKIKETSSVNAIGVRKDWPVLRDIMQKVLDDIDSSERSNIINPKAKLKKNKSSEIKLKLFEKLTEAERAWLNKKQTLHLGVDSNWPPVEWIDSKGAYKGMTSDYINLISDMLGLNIVKPVKTPWEEILHKTKHNEIDILPSIVATTERRKFLNFTSPYLSFPFVIFNRVNAEFIADIKDLYGKKVGIENGYSSKDDLQRDHPKLNLISYPTTQDILHALSLGEIDAYVGNLTVAAYLIKHEGLTNIKVAAPTKYNFDLSIGVRKALPELHSILEKSLSVIDEVSRNEIRQRWLKLNYKVGVDYVLVIKVAIAIAIIMLFTFLWVFVIQRQKNLLRIAKDETDKANVKLKELDHLKSMFIASVSHELRTPLNAVIGFSSIMKNGLYGELNEKYQDYSVRIHKSGQHLLSLITDIIDISKIESGNLDIEISDFQLDEIIEESVVSLQELADSKGISINVNAPKKLTLITDKRRLYQTILNFLSNAVKYSEEGDVTIQVIEEGNTITCSVSDMGVGISGEDMERLFAPFERFESNIKVKAGGTGLGLYLTKKIVVEMLQGDIGAESKLGKGSTFWVRIPKVISAPNLEESK